MIIKSELFNLKQYIFTDDCFMLIIIINQEWLRDNFIKIQLTFDSLKI